MKWPLQKAHIAQKILKTFGKCVTTWGFSVTRQDNDWKIRPCGLRCDPFREACEILLRNHFFNDYDDGRAIP